MISFEHVPSWYLERIGVLKYCLNVRENFQPNLWALWGNEISSTADGVAYGFLSWQSWFAYLQASLACCSLFAHFTVYFLLRVLA